MGSIGPAKILVILVIALIVLGPEKLPQLTRQAGRAWADLRRFRAGLEEEIRGAFGDEATDPLGYVRDNLGQTLTLASTRASPDPPAAPDPPATPAAAGAAQARPPANAGEVPIPPDDPVFN